NPPAQIPYLGRWVTTEPVGVGSRGTPSLERIKLLQPDLILGESFFQQNLYPLLTQIAPTLLFDDLNNPNEIQSWKQDIDGIAEALGREEQVEELLKTHDQQIAQARTALQPVLQTYPRVFVMSSNLGATYIASRPESAVSRLLQEIGFEIVRPSGFPERYVAISQEVIPQVETDLIIVTTVEDNVELNTEDSKPQATMREKWAQNPLLSSMPVFQQGRVFFVDYYLWNGVSRGPLSDQLILEALPDLLLPIVQ
ncbi:MAG: iron-siderophore ABC transporter substrate-binding protein, partial [Cyanobacteria bacterium J06558_2]